MMDITCKDKVAHHLSFFFFQNSDFKRPTYFCFKVGFKMSLRNCQLSLHLDTHVQIDKKSAHPFLALFELHLPSIHLSPSVRLSILPRVSNLYRCLYFSVGTNLTAVCTVGDPVFIVRSEPI